MGRIAYDHKEPKVDYRAFNETADWEPFYGKVEEELPPKMPEPLGRSIQTQDVWIESSRASLHLL